MTHQILKKPGISLLLLILALAGCDAPDRPQPPSVAEKKAAPAPKQQATTDLTSPSEAQAGTLTPPATTQTKKTTAASDPIATGEFKLKPEVDPQTLTQTNVVDVNLGESPEAFVRCLWAQLTGKHPKEDWVHSRAALLGTEQAPRRIDLALLLAEEANVSPTWSYSDPWSEQVALTEPPPKVIDRDLGAVFMFFFTSPRAPNGGPGWANNHSPGMFEPAPIYTFAGDTPRSPHRGYYHPQNAGFWYRELKDARYAGLDFVLLNVYGPDLDDKNMQPLNEALERLQRENGDDVIKIGMLDDTWTWGQPWFSTFWEQRPDCADEEATAKLLYEAKWKPFFSKLPREHWYTVDGRPFIYFYNSNTLLNPQNLAEVIDRMKVHFLEDFGEEPFVAMDQAFMLNREIEEVSDASFLWYTFNQPGNVATSTLNGVSLSHSMPRWDSTSRWNENTERRANAGDILAKNDAILKHVLDQTRDSDILVLATWNDLGEGTGINRTYDYYWDGRWQSPDHFMNLTRRSQAGEIFSNENQP